MGRARLVLVPVSKPETAEVRVTGENTAGTAQGLAGDAILAATFRVRYSSAAEPLARPVKGLPYSL